MKASAGHPYSDPACTAALAPEGGHVLTVGAWNMPVIVRPVNETVHDAIGTYPLAVMGKVANMEDGLETLRQAGLVSVVMVPDPLRGPSVAGFSRYFDHVRPFKPHLTIDLRQGYSPSRHHRERIRRGLRRCRIERGELYRWLDDWSTLYAGLVAHRQVTGMANFRSVYFRCLSEMTGIEAFAAFVEDRIVGMTLWFACDGVVYNHLTACNAEGYANGAAFALYDAAITHFSGQAVVNLGGGAGARVAEDDGLLAFKSGFANGQVTAHICGAILKPDDYAALSQGRDTDFFPAYRAA